MLIRERFQKDKLLRELSTFDIGGPARYFLEVHKSEEMQEVLAYCTETGMPYLVIGKGSNTLFDDRGFDGLVILNKISFCKYNESMVEVGAGYSFSLLGAQTARKGWAGLEFASGIPGSVGGAVYMNAGASGAETKDVLQEVSYVSEKGELQHFKKEDVEFSYRTSSFQKMKGAIVSATFLLSSSSSARQKQLTIVEYRTKTQPYSDPSAGCVFRNPTGKSAGALIQECGLKGTVIGGAEVSVLHANFIVNKGGASSQDVLALVALVKSRVKEMTGIDIHMEIRCIPYQL